MNIVDVVSENLFLKKLFPYGLHDEMLLGQIGFALEGRLSLNVLTRQRPAIEVEKWGAWGKDYISLSLSCWVRVLETYVCIIGKKLVLPL